MNLRQLYNISYYENEIDNIPIQLLRFINNRNNNNINELNIYNDSQNIHDSSIQLSVKESIDRITIRTDLQKYNKDNLLEYIINDNIINCKEQLIEYINDDNIHSLLLLSFAEILWYVLMTIEKDFSEDEQKEIKNILNKDMEDVLGKCFTGRIVRVINCLSGVSEIVNIIIKDESQIGNIIILVKEKLGYNYNVDKHKELVIKELNERSYNKDIIEEWISYIE